MTGIIPSKKVIIVLGAGRTGSSLLMHVLQKLNMTVSEKMTAPSEQNIDGGFEDTDIFAVHSKILKILGTNQLIPLPDEWLDRDELDEPRSQLEEILTDRIDKSQTIFGFKDPRTVLFLPLWKRILNRKKIVPIYLSAVRNPASTIYSLKTQYNFKESVSELFWLHKNCEIFSQTSANCYIVHYEDWFTRGLEMAHELLEYTGLNVHFKENSVEEVLKGIIKNKFNRSIYEDYIVQNEFVTKLYTTLQDCQGSKFNQEAIMQTVKECRKAINGFRGWYQIAFDTGRKTEETIDENKRLSRRNRKLKDNLEQNIQENKQLTIRNRELTADLEKSIMLENSSLKTVQELREKVNQLSGQVVAVEFKSKGLQQKIETIYASTSYQAVILIAKAIKQPGKNTFMLPFRLMILFFNSFKKGKKG